MPEASALRPPARIATTGRVRATARAAETKARRLRMRRRSSSTAPVPTSRASQSSAMAKPMRGIAADADDMAEADRLGRRPVQHDAGQRGGLGHQGQLARRRRDMRQRGVQADRRDAEAEAALAERLDAGAGGDGGEVGRGAGHDRREAAARRQRRHGRFQPGGRQAEHGEVGRLGQRLDAVGAVPCPRPSCRSRAACP